MLRLLSLNDRKIPVYIGQTNQLVKNKDKSAERCHGKNGLMDLEDNINFDTKLLQKENACLGLINLVNENKNEIDLVAVGPLTNLALALNIDPSFGKKLKKSEIFYFIIIFSNLKIVLGGIDHLYIIFKSFKKQKETI